ncbi:MAG: hypothetical protein IPM07_27380 [Anaerolineales bacterium]|nr:hypothetical protein [Anaerolineales bacterium]
MTEVGVDAERWAVEGSGGAVEVVVNGQATYTVTNTAVDVGGESEFPTALDPTTEPQINFNQRLFLPAVLR